MLKGIYLTMALAVSIGLVGCGDDVKQDYSHHSKKENQKQSNSTAGDITWEYDNKENLKVHVDNDFIYMRYDHKSVEPNSQFFLDIDNNQATGVQKEEGADYMVENGWLFEAVDDKEYGWKEVQEVESTVVMGGYDVVKIPIDLLKNKVDTFRVNAQVLDDTWEPVLYTPADLTKKSTYFLN